MVRSIEGRADLLNRCQKNLGCDHTFSISHHAQAVNLTEQTPRTHGQRRSISNPARKVSLTCVAVCA
jgi:hypothetical protein